MGCSKRNNLMLKFEHYWLFHWFEVDEAQLEEDDINRIWQ